MLKILPTNWSDRWGEGVLRVLQEDVFSVLHASELRGKSEKILGEQSALLYRGVLIHFRRFASMPADALYARYHRVTAREWRKRAKGLIHHGKFMREFERRVNI